MSLLYIPEIRNIVLESCRDLITQYNLSLKSVAKNKAFLLSETCGIRIIAGISPIGEWQIEIDFFDPQKEEGLGREYYSDTFLLYLPSRSEPSNIFDKCSEERPGEQPGTFEGVLTIALKCFTAHTLKYRRDILNGDFSSWLPKKAE